MKIESKEIQLQNDEMLVFYKILESSISPFSKNTKFEMFRRAISKLAEINGLKKRGLSSVVFLIDYDNDDTYKITYSGGNVVFSKNTPQKIRDDFNRIMNNDDIMKSFNATRIKVEEFMTSINCNRVDLPNTSTVCFLCNISKKEDIEKFMLKEMEGKVEYSIVRFLNTQENTSI